MDKFRITFVKENITYEALPGLTVLEAQIAAGLSPDAPCGGRGTCGKCRVQIDGVPALACQTRTDRDMEVETGAEQEGEVQILMKGCGRQVSLMAGEFPEDAEAPLLAAIDLGSTSVVAYLLDGSTGKLLAVKSMLNPQRQYGADVVMRCSYALEKGPELLSRCIQISVNGLLRELAKECGRSQEEIVRIVMVGNSCMHHLFLNISTETLALAPYKPKVKEALELKAIDYGLQVHPEAKLYWLANIGGFVGADTVGCMLAANMDVREKMTLLVDIGTNGEMVLGNRQSGLTACSTAAGPAFEGAKITCGMRGSAGAIDHVWVENGELAWHVIGESEPLGICGSGLLDAAACLLKLGIIDDSGWMKETYYFTKKVFINQKDIRELQLAKAAISAGIRMLCRLKGIETDEIEELLIAGAFGNYLNPASACAIGMFPKELEGRIVSVGNAAGEGAQIAALNEEEYRRSSLLAEETVFLELALDPGFQDVYVDELEFPV